MDSGTAIQTKGDLALGKLAQPSGTQTLLRGLDVLETIAGGRGSIAEVCATTGLGPEISRRLCRTLADRGYLTRGAAGLTLGPALLTLAQEADRQIELNAVARPYLDVLADATLEAVHLAIEDEGRVRYVHMVHGRRRLALRSIVGETRPMTRTSLGKALMLDCDDAELRRRFEAERGPEGFDTWRETLRSCAARQTTLDSAEFEASVHCIGAPVRAASGAIVAAISVSSIVEAPTDAWRADLATMVAKAARAISAELGAPVRG